MRIRRNALLAKPERHFHMIGAASSAFRKVAGRSPQASDYEGVHTTTNQLIAAAYAMSAWRQSRHEQESYPVILELNPTGLQALPDVDAIFIGLDAIMRSDVREAARQLLEESSSPNELRTAVENEDFFENDPPGAGDDPSAFVFRHIPNDPIRSLLEALEELGVDDEKTMQIFREWAVDGERPPELALIKMVEQCRYLTNFETDRLVRVVAFKPWWHQILETWWDTDDDELINRAEQIENNGWRIVTTEDDINMYLGEQRVIYRLSDHEFPPMEMSDQVYINNAVEYHGTTSAVVSAAFPDIEIPALHPFPVEDL